MKKYFNVQFLILVLAIPITAVSQTTVQYNGTPFSGGARNAALGSAGAGDALDANSLYWNPAGLSFIRQSSIMFTSHAGFNGRALDNTLSLPPLSIGNDQLIAIGISGSLYGKEWSRNSFSYAGTDMGYSIKFAPTLSMGIVMNLRYGTHPRRSLFASSASVGAFYEPNSGISYGIVFDGIGTGISYSSNGNYSTDGRDSKIYEQQLPKNIRIGLAFRYPSVYRPSYLAILLESGKTFGIDGQTYRGGIELLPFQFLSARAGIISLPTITSGTMGLGISLNAVQIDYAVYPTTSVNGFHQLSISYMFSQ